MLSPQKPVRKLYGQREVGFSRYFALYVTQIGWFVLGAFLLARADWPSSCHPGGLLDVYRCSMELPVNRGWVEGALATWLWSTPILIALELMRRFGRPDR